MSGFLIMDGVITNAGQGVGGFCYESAPIWQFVGILLLVFKIVIPILLIVLGAVDLGKAVISDDEKAINKQVKIFSRRIIAAVAIFFIPYVVSAIFSLIGTFNEEAKADYEYCKACVVHPKRANGDCINAVNASNN